MAVSMEFKRKIPDNMNPWTCEVNGVKYVYEAGTEQYVPEEVAHIIDAYWKSVEPVKGGSGGAGGGDSRFVVKATWDENWNLSFDRTFEEIMMACMAHKEVVLRDGAFTYPLVSYDGEMDMEIIFSGLDRPGGEMINFINYVIKPDGKWRRYYQSVHGSIEFEESNFDEGGTT